MTTSYMTEDLDFPFGGYWKGTLADLMEGDGVRLLPDLHLDCLHVEAIAPEGDKITVTFTNRSVHVAGVLADAFHRPIEGMSSDPNLHSFRALASTPCWIRL